MIIFPEDYGWVPGILDMGSAQAAIDAAMAMGATLQFSAGTYLVDATGPARPVDSEEYYYRAINGTALRAGTSGADLVLQGIEGETTIKMATEGSPAALLFA